MNTRAPASVEVRRLHYRYPGAPREALHDVEFHIAPGERVGLLGPNGAGKSTLMRLLCGYLVPPRREGLSLRVAGLSVLEQDLAVRERVGYLPELVPLYLELRVLEHLSFRAAIKRVPRKARPAEIRRVAEATGLVDMLEVPIGRLSRGYRQRVGIADALLGAPPLVVLDEPTVGLDPNQVQGIRSMLERLGGGQTLIFSSHVLAEVEQLCDRILILSEGRLVADEAVSEALAGALIVEFEAEVAAVRKVVEAARKSLGLSLGEGSEDRYEVEQGVCRVEVAGATLDAEAQGELDASASGSRADASRSGARWEAQRRALAAAIGRAARDAELAILRLEPARRRLEERFARATGFVEGEGEST